MNDSVINIKTDAKTKREAQKIAKEFGVSLSSLVTMSLRQIVRSKRFDLSLIPEESPLPDELRALRKGLDEYKRGDTVALESL